MLPVFHVFLFFDSRFNTVLMTPILLLTRFQNVIFGLPIIENKLELPQWIVDSTMSLFGDGNTPIAYTDLRDIGIFIARIIADPRTLNRYVFIWGEERTQREVFDIARAASGRDIQPVHVSRSSRSTSSFRSRSSS